MNKLILKILLILLILVQTSSAHAATLNVQTVVRQALATHPDVRSAELKLRSAENTVRYAYAMLWPSVTLKGAQGNSYVGPYEHFTGDAPKLESSMPDETVKVLQTGATAVMPVFVAAAWQGASIADTSRDLTASDLAKARMDTAYNAMQAFYQLLLARRTADLLERRLTEAKEAYQQIKARYDSGMVQKTDALRSEIQLRDIEQNLLTSRKDLALAEINFRNYVPSPDVTTMELQADTIPTDRPAITYEEAREKMYATRPEWQAFVLNKKISRANYDLALSDLYPTFQLVGSETWTNTEYHDFGFDQKNWSVLLQGSWLVFNGLGNLNKSDSARDTYESVLAGEATVTRQMELELKDAYLSYQQDLLQSVNARKMLELSRENYNQVKARYLSGVDSNLNYLDASNTLLSSEIGLVNAEVNVLLAKARLERIQGTIL
jgi:outer membrane protein TolC